MENEQVFELLKARFKDHVPVDDGLMALFEENGKIIRIGRKRLLVTPGTLDESTYFIAKGAFLMAIVTEAGETKTTTFYLDHYNDFLTCPDSAYLHVPTSYEVKAAEDSIVIRFTRKFINELQASNPQFLTYSLHEVQRTMAMSYKIRDARLALPAAKFLQFLYDQYPLLFQHFPSQNIAEYMGITPVWLSNLKKRFFS